MNAKAIIQNFLHIVKHEYFCFEGRMTRKSFWCYILVCFIGNCILGLIPGIGNYLAAIWALALLLPTIGAYARRLHDIGKSGYWQLIIFVPFVGAIILLLLCAKPAMKEANEYGEAVTE